MRVPLLAFALLVGCAPPAPYLRWSAQPPPPTMEGRIVIRDVINKRPPKKGADTPQNVGNVRSGFGIPYAVRLDGGAESANVEPRTLTEAMSEFAAISLSQAGLAVVGPADPQPTAHLWVEVLELWCDGYMGYGATVSLQLVLTDPRSQALRTKVPVRQEGHGPSCRDAYTNALNVVQSQIAAAFLRPDVHAAAVGAGGPPMPAAYPAPGAPPPAMPPDAPQPEPVGACPTGMTVSADTVGHCCWPGQVFSRTRNVCVGVPQSCPPGTHAAAEACVR
jgi:hypothetical protein